MTIETIQDLLRKTPFQPFEVRMSDGESYEVRHPEFAFVLKTNLVIGDPDSDRVWICALLHVASVETLQPSA